MATLQLFDGLFRVQSQTITVDSTDVSFTGGFRHLLGSDGHLEELQRALRTYDSGFYVIYSITLECVYIISSTSHSITWTGTDLRDKLGFSGNLSSATAHYAGTEPLYIWKPSKCLTNRSGDADLVFLPESKTKVTVSASGEASTVHRDYIAGYTTLDYEWLSKDECIKTEDPDYQTFQQFFEDIISNGYTFQYFPDRDNDDNYVTAIAGKPNSEIGKFDTYCRRSEKTIDLFFNVKIPMIEYIQ